MSTKHLRTFSSLRITAKSLAVVFGFVLAPMLTSNVAAESARMATFANDSGATCFALSVLADIEDSPQAARHLVVLVDTSASQAGTHREEALATVVSLLNGLASQDRVQLFAADLNIVPLHESAALAKSPEIEAALAKLRARAPLGATDIAEVMTAAAKSLESAPLNARRIVYIGDGISQARLLESDDFQPIIDILAAKRISVTSVALGPRKNVALLAALANHTGGNVLVATSEVSGQQLGSQAAKASRAAVAWPTSVNAPEDWAENFPNRFPPLRGDRDSIVIGSLKAPKSPSAEKAGVLSVQFDVDGNDVTQQWTLAAEPSSEDFSYLPKLLDMAREDNGIFLPTAGSAALREVRRVLQGGASGLTSLAGSALQSGDLLGAEALAGAALEADPGNSEAEVIRDAVKRRKDQPKTQLMQFEGTIDEDGPLVLESAPEPQPLMLDEAVVPAQATGPIIVDGQPIEFVQPGMQMIPGEVIVDSISAPMVDFGPSSIVRSSSAASSERDANFLNEAEQRRLAREGLLKVEVRNTIAAARQMLGESPEESVGLLKNLLETVRRGNDISADVRAQLNDQVRSATRSAQREVINFNIRQAESSERQAQAAERSKILAAMRRKEVRTLQILDRFNALMDEGRYVEAENVAFEAEKLQPNNVVPQMAILTSRMVGRVRENARISDLSERGVVRALALVQEAAIPTPDEPALVYPPADVWEELSIRRAPYASIDLAKPGSAEARIFGQLEEVTGAIDFADTSLQDVIQIIREDNDNMNMVLDTAALDLSGIDPETPITQTLNGVTLRSALRLILKGLDLTYIVKDEVLLITTREEAENQLVTKVYPVADLVMPITNNIGGGMGGGGGGMNGGGMGGGGGGMGGGGMGGGGMGGGGMGGGGGGGMFAVEDVLRLGSKSNPSESDAASSAPTTAPTTAATSSDQPAPSVKASRPGKNIKEVTWTGDQTPRDAWHAYFQRQLQLPEANQLTDADVRETVRVRMQDRKFDEASAVIQSALAAGLAQPWMFEALGLALKADGKPQAEIERAFMSSVDLAVNMEELFYAATYMSRIGLDERALSLLEQVAAANPTRPEPFAMALKVAQRTENAEALRWACVGVLENAWPGPLQAIETEAKRSAKATLTRLLQAQEADVAESFRMELNNALVRDCKIDVSWTGEADVDILVQEPSGTICSIHTPRTNGGGVLLGDASSEMKKTSSEAITESYVCPKGLAGKYKLMLRPIWGQVAAGKVKVKITTHAGTSGEQVIEKSIELGDEPSLVVFDLNEGRLKKPLADHMVETAAHKQIAINRTVLTQQLNSDPASSDVIGDLAFDRALGLLPQLNRAVGFRPVITTLPEGTSMSATAIISADRRYIRVTAAPSFSSVSRVDTFNFVSGDGENVENNQGGGAGGNLGGGNVN